MPSGTIHISWKNIVDLDVIFQSVNEDFLEILFQAFLNDENHFAETGMQGIKKWNNQAGFSRKALSGRVVSALHKRLPTPAAR